MCICDPRVRAPWCGKFGCEMPKQNWTISEVRKATLEVIVDLIIMRAKYISPEEGGLLGATEHIFKYNFFSSAIAILYDKHKVKDWEIKEIMREQFNPKTGNKE